MSGILFSFFAIELLVVAYGDVKEKKIFNIWSLLNLLFFAILCFAFPDLYSFHIKTFLFPLVIFATGFVLFLLKIMGGGDTKFLSTFFLVVPYGLHERLFILLMYSTCIIGAFILVTNTASNFSEIVKYARLGSYKEVKKYFGSKFSFAPVILIAWIWLGWSIKIFP